MDKEEKNEIIQKQLQKNLNISDKDIEEIVEKNENRKNKKAIMKKIRMSLLSIAINVAMTLYALFVAITEKNTLYWTVGFIFIGLTVMEILFIRRKMFPNQYEKEINSVKYCAQITSVSSSIRKQDLFSTIDKAKGWIEKTAKDGEQGVILDTANGKILKTYDRRFKNGKKGETIKTR